jgi:CRP/FNR family transcriptional regulator, anaerobic regulatory protein
MDESTRGDGASEPCVALVPVFRDLDAAQQQEVARLAKPRRVRRGEPVFRAGEATARLYVVHEGRVRISRRSASGHEHVLRILGAGDVVGEAAFLGGGRPETDAIALEDCRLCVFDHARLDDLIRRYPDVAVRMVRTLSERLASTERILAAVTSADVRTRVAAYLLDCPVVGRNADHVLVRLPAAKKDIASYLGTTPESFSRALAALAADGVIGTVAGREVEILDGRRLEDLGEPS